jgi:integrase
VNRELDTLRGIFSKAVEWGKLRDNPMRMVKRLKVDNRRTRILTEAEQTALLKVCRPKFGRMVRLALITGARFGEILALTWADVAALRWCFWRPRTARPAGSPSGRQFVPC